MHGGMFGHTAFMKMLIGTDSVVGAREWNTYSVLLIVVENVLHTLIDRSLAYLVRILEAV